MLLQRDSRRASVGALPPPAPLYDLRSALQRRAEVFGPYDGDGQPATARGALARLAAVLHGVAALLEPARAPT